MIDELRARIRDVADFPTKGVVFKDITPVLGDAALFRRVVETMAERHRTEKVSKVVGIEREVYALEYGQDVLEIHVDAIGPGERVLVVDDVLATGGTAAAAGRLVTRQGAELLGFTFLLELGFLHGASRLEPANVHALVKY